MDDTSFVPKESTDTMIPGCKCHVNLGDRPFKHSFSGDKYKLYKGVSSCVSQRFDWEGALRDHSAEARQHELQLAIEQRERREMVAMEEATNEGKFALLRWAGEAGSSGCDIERHAISAASRTTVAAPSYMVAVDRKAYYEVEVLRCSQSAELLVGWSTLSTRKRHASQPDKGVGQIVGSWSAAVDFGGKECMMVTVYDNGRAGEAVFRQSSGLKAGDVVGVGVEVTREEGQNDKSKGSIKASIWLSVNGRKLSTGTPAKLDVAEGLFPAITLQGEICSSMRSSPVCVRCRMSAGVPRALLTPAALVRMQVRGELWGTACGNRANIGGRPRSAVQAQAPRSTGQMHRWFR